MRRNLDHRFYRFANLKGHVGFFAWVTLLGVAPVPQAFGSSSIPMDAGWNLLPAPNDPDGALLHSWKQQGLSVWKAEAFESPESHESSEALGEVDGLSGRGGVWVFAKTPTNIQMYPTTPTSSIAAGWHFLHVAQETPHGDPNIKRLYTWDGSKQRYARVRVGENLQPMQGYWGHAEEDVDPFQETCLPETWDERGAKHLVEHCPFSGPVDVIPRAQPGAGEDTEAGQDAASRTESSRIVLSATETAADLEVQAFVNSAIKNGEDHPGHHFVLAQKAPGQWEVFEGLPLAPRGSAAGHDAKLPAQIRIAIMGTYSQAVGQPPRNAVIRLAELVAHLRDTFDRVEDIAPPEAPSAGIAHIVDALHARFFAPQVATNVHGDSPQPDPAASNLSPAMDDLTPPALHVHNPLDSRVYTARDWISIVGEVSDAHLQALSINGVEVTDASSSFSEVLFLEPGANHFEVRATDRFGNTTLAPKTIYLDQEAPFIHATATVVPATANEEKTLQFDIQVQEANLVHLRINDTALPAQRELSYRIPANTLPLGLSQFTLRAIDRVGHRAEYTLAVEVEPDRTLSVIPSQTAPAQEEAQSALASVPSADQTPPTLTILSPTASPLYTQHATWLVRGQATDPELSSVTLNGVLVAASGRAFSYPVNLKKGHNAIQIVARDLSKNRSEQHFDLFHDPEAPVIGLDHRSTETVYEPTYLLRGRVTDRLVASLYLVRGPDDPAQAIALTPAAQGNGPSEGPSTFAHQISLRPGENNFTLVAEDQAANRTAIDLAFTYVLEWTDAKTPLAPKGLTAIPRGDTAVLVWKAVTRFDDGQAIPKGVRASYRIYRDDTQIEVVSTTEYQDVVTELDRTYSYHVTAVVRSATGEVFESEPSDVVPLNLGEAPPPVVAGAFELPSIVTGEDASVALPKVALSKHKSGALAHLVHVHQDANQGPAIRYAQSEKSGKDQSFEAGRPIVELTPDWEVIDLAIAAQGDTLSIAWIQTKSTSQDDAQSEVWTRQSNDGGVHFLPAEVVHTGTAWKRGLDVGYDRLNNHHLVWGEANKVYYLKNLEGEPENVFDTLVREKNDIVVDYYLNYIDTECDNPPPCGCADFPNEKYTYALEQDPETGKPLGPYFYRTEEAWMGKPSLEIDDEHVSIIAVQDRLWDNRPVPNPDWKGEFGPAVPPMEPSAGDTQTWCSPNGARKEQKGFMQVWQYRSGRPAPYSPKKLSKTEHARRLAKEKSPKEAFDYYYGEGQQRFVSYDPNVTHKKDWYFYLYDGTWHEEDKLRVAQRPVTDGAWSKREMALVDTPQWPITRGLLSWAPVATSVEQGWSQGSWKDGVRQDWRLSVVSELAHNVGSSARSPKLVFTGKGQWVAIYDDGPSDNPNKPGQNPIYVRVSGDGGLSWSLPKEVGRGYQPDAAATQDGEFAVVYYEAHPSDGDASTSSKIQVAQSYDFESWTRSTLNVSAPEAIHWNTHGSGADRLIGVPSLTAYEDLFFASWVQKGQNGGRIVTSRASRAEKATHYDVAHESDITVAKSALFTVTAVNKYDMRVHHDGAVRISTSVASKRTNSGLQSSAALVPAESGGTQSAPSPNASSGSHRTGSSSSPSSALRAEAPVAPSESITNAPLGQVALAESPVHAAFATPLELQNGQLQLVTAVDNNQTVIQVVGTDGDQTIESTTTVTAYTQDAEGNYTKAQDARRALLRTVEGDGKSWTYQVEYAPRSDNPEAQTNAKYYQDPEAWNQGDLADSKHLAGFERVWVYTQGIALAQLSKRPDDASMDAAQGMARYLCAHAEKGTAAGETVIRGWPFSWNTKNDSWKDARLVTGANAWAIQGLGTFVVSEAFKILPESEQSELSSCYRQALSGLEEHRRVVYSPSVGANISMMTAGWTSVGLKHAANPASISSGGSGPLEPDAGVRWAYYSVLDALGYETFDEEQAPEIKRFSKDSQELNPLVLTEDHLATLKTRVIAENVVTEHNLDVLSVLNHAIIHADETGIKDVEHLRTWRDELREAIFDLLWDDEGWKNDLQETLADDGVTVLQQQRIEHALNKGVLGRVVTGGTLTGDHAPYELKQSKHVAIDNCSWLSLSVNYEDLKADSLYVDRLAKCLEYTELHFAKDLLFGSKRYYGTHYFQNAFRDPYIDPSELQESSFHLEATTGLILGLHRFAEARPNHPSTPLFRAKANELWNGVQAFVRDHGFPYSSQRIQDLSTLLSSSTAVIWFIDVYHELGETDDLNRPLKNYASHLDLHELVAVIEESYPALLEKSQTTDSDEVTTSSERVESFRNPDDASMVTDIEDQAIAIVAAVNQGDFQTAGTWVRGLMSARQAYKRIESVDDQGGTTMVLDLEFPQTVSATATQDAINLARDTGTQMLAYYALAWFVTRDEGESGSPKNEAARALEQGLATMFDKYYVFEHPNLGGLFVAGDAVKQDDEQRIAITGDNILAYFALREAVNMSTFDDEGLRDRALSAADRLEGRLNDLCWDQNLSSVAGVVEDAATSQWEPSHRTLFSERSLCVLFLSHVGRVGPALELMKALQFFRFAEIKRQQMLAAALLGWLASENREPGGGGPPPETSPQEEDHPTIDFHSLQRFMHDTIRAFSNSWHRRHSWHIRHRSEEHVASPLPDTPALTETQDANFEESPIGQRLAELVAERPDLLSPAGRHRPRSELESGKRRIHWAELLGRALTKRALSFLDPRQEDLALLDLDQLITELPEATATRSAATLLIQNPDGFLGVKAGMLLPLPSDDATGYERFAAKLLPDRRPSQVFELHLAEMHQDTIRALLLSEYRADRFDALFNRLTMLRLVAHALQAKIRVGDWLDRYGLQQDSLIYSTNQYLENLCNHYDAPFAPPTALSFEEYFGIPCEQASSMYQELRNMRLGDNASEVALVVSKPGLQEWGTLLRALDKIGRVARAGHVVATSAIRCVTCELPVRPSLAKASNLVEVQAALRDALSLSVAPAFIDSSELELHLGAVDPVSAFHAESPTYWTQAAVIFRAATERNNLRFWYQKPIDGLSYPETPTALARVKALRQTLNQVFDGQFNDHRVGLITVEAVQTMLRTGQMHANDFNSMLHYSHLSSSSHQRLKDKFEFGPPPTLGPDDVPYWSGSDLTDQERMMQWVRHQPGAALAVYSALAINPKLWHEIGAALAETIGVDFGSEDAQLQEAGGFRIVHTRATGDGTLDPETKTTVGSDGSPPPDTTEDFLGSLEDQLRLRPFLIVEPEHSHQLIRPRSDLRAVPDVLLVADLPSGTLAAPGSFSIEDAKIENVTVRLQHVETGADRFFVACAFDRSLLSPGVDSLAESSLSRLGHGLWTARLHVDSQTENQGDNDGRATLQTQGHFKLAELQSLKDSSGLRYPMLSQPLHCGVGLQALGKPKNSKRQPTVAVSPLSPIQTVALKTRDFGLEVFVQKDGPRVEVRFQNPEAFRAFNHTTLSLFVVDQNSVPADYIVRSKDIVFGSEAAGYAFFSSDPSRVHGRRLAEFLAAVGEDQTLMASLSMDNLAGTRWLSESVVVELTSASSAVEPLGTLASAFAETDGVQAVRIEPTGTVALLGTIVGGYSEGAFTLSNPSAEPITVQVTSTAPFVEVSPDRVVLEPFTEAEPIKISVNEKLFGPQKSAKESTSELEFETVGVGVESRLVQVFPMVEPEGEILSFGLGESGRAYLGLWDGHQAEWVDSANLTGEHFDGPDEVGFIGHLAKYTKPGVVLSTVIKKGTTGLVKGTDDIAKGSQSVRVGMGELMVAGTALSTLVAASLGDAENWATLVQLDRAPDEATEPWEFVGVVEEHEVTTYFGLMFKDEDIIRDHVKIHQSHIRGGFSTSTVEFDPNSTYGLVKEVQSFMGVYDVIFPTGAPVAVYRLRTDLTPEEVVDEVVDIQFPWMDAAVETWAGDNTLVEDVLNGFREYALEPLVAGEQTHISTAVKTGPISPTHGSYPSVSAATPPPEEPIAQIYQDQDTKVTYINDPAWHQKMLEGNPDLIQEGDVLFVQWDPNCEPKEVPDEEFDPQKHNLDDILQQNALAKLPDEQLDPGKVPDPKKPSYEEILQKRIQGNKGCWVVVPCRLGILQCLEDLRRATAPKEIPFQAIMIPPTLGLKSLYIDAEEFLKQSFENPEFKDKNESPAALAIEDYLKRFFEEMEEKYGVTREQLESRYYVLPEVTAGFGQTEAISDADLDIEPVAKDGEEARPKVNASTEDVLKHYNDSEDYDQLGDDFKLHISKLKARKLVLTITLIPKEKNLIFRQIDKAQFNNFKKAYPNSLTDFLKLWHKSYRTADFHSFLALDSGSLPQQRVEIVMVFKDSSALTKAFYKGKNLFSRFKDKTVDRPLDSLINMYGVKDGVGWNGKKWNWVDKGYEDVKQEEEVKR